MFDQLCYENRGRQFTEIAVANNKTAREKWLADVQRWLQDAAWKRSLNRTDFLPKPYLPELLMWVEAPPWEEGASQASIKLNWGPARVVEGQEAVCELPPPPPVNPPGTVDIGGPLPENPGLFVRGQRDTMPLGAIVTKDDKKYRRTGFLVGWGWYELVKD